MREGMILFGWENIWQRVSLIKEGELIEPEEQLAPGELFISEMTPQEKRMYTWITLSEKWIKKIEEKIKQDSRRGPTKKMRRRIGLIKRLQKDCHFLARHLYCTFIRTRLDPDNDKYQGVPILLRSGFGIVVEEKYVMAAN